jgi:hypothetical protein
MRETIFYVAAGISLIGFSMFLVTGSGWAVAVAIIFWLIMVAIWLKGPSDE